MILVTLSLVVSCVVLGIIYLWFQKIKSLFITHVVSELVSTLSDRAESEARSLFSEVKGYIVIFILSYLLFILLFGLLFWFSYDYQPTHTFEIKHPSKYHLIDFLYYSTVTITTLGYGDIVPTSAYAKIFSMIEVIVGILMMIVFAGILLSFLQEYPVKFAHRVAEQVRELQTSGLPQDQGEKGSQE